MRLKNSIMRGPNVIIEHVYRMIHRNCPKKGDPPLEFIIIKITVQKGGSASRGSFSGLYGMYYLDSKKCITLNLNPG